MSQIKPGPMPPKPPRRPERGTPAWYQMKRDEARERKTRREAKREEPAKPRKRLKQRSDTKEWFYQHYLAALRFLIRLDPLCRCCRERPATEGHHPFGQRGWLIFIFWPFCRICHTSKEDRKNEAREEGWILYQ